MGLARDLDDFWPYEAQWKALDELVERAEKDLTPDVVDALLRVFERFSGGADGRGVFVRISQVIESFDGHQAHLHQSLTRKPSTWTVRMAQRLMETSSEERKNWVGRFRAAMQHPDLTSAVRDDMSEVLDDHGEEAPTVSMPRGGSTGEIDPSVLIRKNVDDDIVVEFLTALGTSEKQYEDSCYIMSFPADGVALIVSYDHEITDVSCFVRNQAYARYGGVLPLGIESGLTKRSVIDCVGRAPDQESGSHMTWYDDDRRVGIDYSPSGSISLVHVGEKTRE